MKLPFDESKFKTKKELFKHIVANKEDLITHAKSIIKEADAYSFFSMQNKVNNKETVNKDNEFVKNPPNELNVLAVINTTNLMDSHKDVHMPGLWSKSLQENQRIKHRREHKQGFDMIISSGIDLIAYAKTYSWKDLGYDLEGKTEALVFDSNVRKERNSFMHEQYAKGYVDNHSVGMRYVKLTFCCNDDDFGAEFEAWEKYFPSVLNKEDAENAGYFWAVTEAKIIEGSAVGDGSNHLTPTLENNKTKPPKALKSLGTSEPRKALDINKLINLL